MNIEPQTLMNAIAFIELTLYPEDLKEELEKAGAPEGEISDMVFAFVNSGSSLIDLYRQYAYKSVTDPNDWRKYLSMVLESQIQKYLNSEKPGKTVLFTKQYDGDTLCDMNRDIHEAFSTDFNPEAKALQTDEHNMVIGTVTITMEYDPKES